ncbi:SulP family inorganic anion transporter [Oleidesulfovibrio sp.]|uniref:SulP family inorganic anion transporter n=1 Tax=Oleidesulfovibrio sp. TaxID=2909707 RepID=UPI003A8737FE
MKSGITTFLPFLSWLPKTTPQSARADLLAGLTGAIIVLPQGVAFATLAGLPPEYGIYTAIVPAIIAALFGSSMHLVSGPTTAISLVIFSNVSELATAGTPYYIGLVLSMTLLAGLIQFILGSARLGSVVNFVSHSVLTGFTTGAAILIAASQLSGFAGVSIPRSGFLPKDLWALFSMLPQASWHAAAIAMATFVTALLVRSIDKRLPAMLVAMIVGGLVCLGIDGAENGVRMVGALHAAIPPFSVPEFDPQRLGTLLPGALAVAMLGLAEAVSIARSIGTLSHQRIDNNQEFIGQGLSNIVGCFFSAYASSGSFTRTGVNYAAGARSPLSAIFAALLLVGLVSLMGGLAAYLPLPAMAGVIMLVAWNLLDFEHIRRIMRAGSGEPLVFAVTLVSTLTVKLEFALIAGVALSLLIYLHRTTHPHFMPMAPVIIDGSRHIIRQETRALPECPQIKILRLDGSLFFGAAEHVAEELEEVVEKNRGQDHILIIASGINFIDYSGCETIFEERRLLQASGIKLYMCSANPGVKATMERMQCGPSIPLYADKAEAIAQIVPELDMKRCATCTRRVFQECATLPGAELEAENTEKCSV